MTNNLKTRFIATGWLKQAQFIAEQSKLNIGKINVAGATTPINHQLMTCPNNNKQQQRPPSDSQRRSTIAPLTTVSPITAVDNSKLAGTKPAQIATQ
jgi:hypothetical protein